MKKKTQFKRALAMLACVLLAVSFLFSAWFAAGHIGHHCTGHDCPVCLLIHRLTDSMRKLALLFMMLAASLLTILDAVRVALLYHAISNKKEHTPITLKVQLNN